MDPILPVGIDRPGLADRLGSIRNLFPGPLETSPTQQLPSNMGLQSISSLQISSSVSQLLQSIGGGTESNKMLELMITLLILMTMLDQQQSAKASEDLLSGLGRTAAGRFSQTSSFSMTSLSIQSSSVSIVQFQTSQSCATDSGAPTAPRVDIVG